MRAGEEHGFCDERAVAGVEGILAPSIRNEGVEFAFLVLSGAFNPVHVQHVVALNVARLHAEGRGWVVVGAFLAPSNDTYVEAKLGEMALSLQFRRRLCRLAVGGSDWIHVCSRGEFSSNTVSRGIRGELENQFAGVLQGHRLTAVEIMGSDTVVRIFARIMEDNKRGLDHVAQTGRTIFCFLRPGAEHATEREHVRKVLLPAATDLGIELYRIDNAQVGPPAEWVSSSAIRALMYAGRWEVLRSRGWLHPAVLSALRRSARRTAEREHGA